MREVEGKLREQILLKLPKPLVRQIDKQVKRGGYNSRQEWIRTIIRDYFRRDEGNG